jgi:hypothetical protein
MTNQYRVFQKAEIWYVTKVEANSPEEAQALVESNDFDGEWELDLGTTIVNDEYDVHKV